MAVKSQTLLKCFLIAILLGLGAGCHKSSRPWDDKVATAKKPKGLIRIIPIKPLVGADYPLSTVVSSVEQKLTFPSFPGKQTAWFAIELSGWGPSGLKGYSAQITRVDSICPRAPCGCMTSANETACSVTTPGDCAEGSECSGGACANAFIDKGSTDFVFYGLSHTASITSIDPTYTYYVGLDKGDILKDTGTPVIGGFLAISATDGCPDGPTTDVMFDTSSLPFFVLGDDSVVYPVFSGAHIFFEP